MSAAMAALVLFSRPLNKTKILWSLMSIGICIWSFGTGWVSSAINYETALHGARLAYFGVILIPLFFIHSVSVMIHWKNRALIMGLYMGAILLEILHFSGNLVSVWPMGGFPYYIKALPPYFLFFIYIATLVVITETVLLKEAARANPITKKQCLIMFAGSSLGFLGGFSLIPLKYGIPFSPYGNLLVSLHVILVAYGMFRYELMDFKPALKRFAAAASIYVSLLILSLPLSWPLLMKIASQNKESIAPIFLLVIILTLVLSSGPAIYATFIRRKYWLKGNITTGLTHELKSPLASIQSATDILMEKAANPESKTNADTYLTMIQKNADRLDGFVKDLLTIARIQDDNINISKSPVDLGFIVGDTLSTYTPLAEQKKLQILTDIPPIDSARLDEDKFRQILSNLVSNAIKYSDRGTIRIKAEKKGGNIIFSVSDEGRGVKKENLERIFDRFYQSSTTHKGAGVGLAIAKAWVEAHNGKIWANSKGEGQGTQITFTLPIT